jgi:hypothetical protein
MVVATAAPFGEDMRADRWDRYLALVLDALAAEGHRGTLPPLEPPPHCEVAERLEVALAGSGPSESPGSPTRPSEHAEN